MKYYIIAGEASGDLHGSNLMKGLKKSDPDAQFRFWGGDKMADVGGRENLAKHYKQTSFMGFVEILKNLGKILGQINECKRDIVDFQPDVMILIDYAGFNLRIAKFTHKLGIKNFYYISPKVWAWNESRVKLLKKYVNQLFTIFPFETEYFAKHGIKVIYEGNPLMDSIAERTQKMPCEAEFKSKNGLDERPIIALLGGSRKTEIRFNLPFMVELSKQFTEYQFVVAGVSWLDKELYNTCLSDSSVRFVTDKTYELLSVSTAAIVTSGTATLETALIGTPEIVCYRAGRVSMLIAKAFIRVPYISLVNLVLNREAVRELYLADMNVATASKELRAILPGGVKYEKLQADYAELREMTGGAGASERFAKQMVDLLNNNQ